MNEACNGIFFCPAPWGSREGSKDQILFNFNYKVNFKDVLYQTLRLVMPQEWAFWVLGVPRGSKNI